MDKNLFRLYLGDSSDEEETIYPAQSMGIKIKSLKVSGKSLFVFSFLLLENPQSINESREIRKVY